MGILDKQFKEAGVNYLWGVIAVYMGIWRQLEEYFFIKKRDPNTPNTQWMRYMHRINRLAILMFLVGIIVLILRNFVFKRH